MIERAPDVEQAMRDSFDAMKRRDLETLLSRTSEGPGVVLIGSAAEEWYRGRDELMRMGDEMEGGGEGPVPTLDDVEAYSEGDVGWAAVHATWRMGGTSVPFRLTVVMHREDGVWKHVQSHASIGVPNDQMMNPMFQAAGAAAT
jgi:ketosteroid isomerase-like protein